MKSITLVILILTPIITFSQDCDCISNFEWVRKTFEENDAGFTYSLKSKGELAYKLHNEEFLLKLESVQDPSECNQLLYQWLTFFRSGHIGIRSLLNHQNSAVNHQPSDQEIIDRFKDWEKISIDLEIFKSNITSNNPLDIEGIWSSGPYEIGIKKTANEYLGFIIKADGVYWREGQIKLRLREDTASVYYMQDHSERHFQNYQLLGKNVLQVGFITLNRKYPSYESERNVERYLRLMNTENPIFERIDDKSNLLRIPTFAGSEKLKIDSFIAHHKEDILNSPNLIVDIRNNGGGDDRCYYELLPFLYTDTIRNVGLEFLSTPLNNERMKDFAFNPEYGFTKSEQDEFETYYKLLSVNIGKFVNLDSSIVDKTHYDTIYPYPQNVSILINGGNGSTSEQFLLAAKQSKKVKLFGTRTYGSLDISNMNFVKSPCEEFELGYCLSRSFRIPEMSIDEVGIQPDYYLDNSIKDYKWIEFVQIIDR